MRRHLRWSYGLAGLVALGTLTLTPVPEAGATSTFKIALRRAVRSADLVLEGKIRGFRSLDAVPTGALPGQTFPGLHYTDVKIAVDQVYKGHLERRSHRVRVFGGTKVGRTLRGADLPFRTGERVLLMLWHNGKDDFPFVGFHQGIYRIRPTGPGGTMPDLASLPRPCSTCSELVLDGRDHVVTGIGPAGMVRTFNAGMLPAFRVFIAAHQPEASLEVQRPQGGVLPLGTALPDPRLTGADLREAVWQAVAALGLPRDLPRLGNPAAPVAASPALARPIVIPGESDASHRHDPEDVPLENPPPDVPGGSGPNE